MYCLQHAHSIKCKMHRQMEASCSPVQLVMPCLTGNPAADAILELCAIYNQLAWILKGPACERAIGCMQVVQDAKRAKITLFDGQSFEAEVKGTEPDKDLAVLKITQPGRFVPISVGSSGGLQVSLLLLCYACLRLLSLLSSGRSAASPCVSCRWARKPLPLAFLCSLTKA